MDYFLGIVVFVVLVAISIALHELGHLIPAKLFRVRVSQYMIGFGPTLFSRTKGETEYGVKAFPLGGYIRMVGMYSPHISSGAPKRGWRASLANEARQYSAEEIEANGGDESRAFYNLSTPKKLVIMLGGPTMNLILALVLTGIALVGVGTPMAVNKVGTTVACVAQMNDPTASCGNSTATPAESAGLKTGDALVSWNGKPIGSWADFTADVSASGGKSAQLGITRGGQPLTLSISPLASGTNADGSTHYIIGVQAGFETYRAPITSAPGSLWQQISGSAGVLVKLPVSTYQAAVAMVDKNAVSAADQQNRALSLVGAARISGEISSDASLVVGASAWQERWGMWLSLGASINIALWLFNLIPFLPLDGGHVAGGIWEGIKRSRAKRRGALRPPAADTARFMPPSYAVFAVILVMAAVLVVADFVNPVQLG